MFLKYGMRCLCSYYTLFSMLSRRNQSSNFKRHRLHIWEHRRIHAFSAQHQLFPLSVLCSSAIFPSSIPTKPCSPSIRQYATPAYYISMLADCCKTDPCLYTWLKPWEVILRSSMFLPLTVPGNGGCCVNFHSISLLAWWKVDIINILHTSATTRNIPLTKNGIEIQCCQMYE